MPTKIHEMNIAKGYNISTDKNLLDLSYIHEVLTESYWAKGIPVDVVEKSIEGSMCFGVHQGANQVGFARIITDKATFAYLADVFIDSAHRGIGLGKALVEFILAHPDLQGLRGILLGTLDAYGLYAKYGFEPLPDGRFMRLRNPNPY